MPLLPILALELSVVLAPVAGVDELDLHIGARAARVRPGDGVGAPCLPGGTAGGGDGGELISTMVKFKLVLASVKSR